MSGASMGGMAKAIVAKMGGGDGGDGEGENGGKSKKTDMEGLTVGHIAAMDRFMAAVSDRKTTEAAKALRDFIDLCMAYEQD